MPRIRTIKPEFWADEKLSSCDPQTRLVFLGLIGMSDDSGRLLDNVKVIDAFIFPNTSDTCRDALATLSRMRRIARGTTKSGQSVIQIVNWARHQKVDKPNNASCLPELVTEIEYCEDDTTIRDGFATDSRDIRDALALRPTTDDHGPTTDDRRPINTGHNHQGNGVPNGTVKKKPSFRFVPPTLEEVEAYCEERGNRVPAQIFLDYYEANGWKVGRNPMKNWKAAVRTWEKNYPAPESRVPTEEDLKNWTPTGMVQ